MDPPFFVVSFFIPEDEVYIGYVIKNPYMMEKSYLLLMFVFILGTTKAQTQKDSIMNEPIVVNEEVIGNLDQMLNGKDVSGQPTLTFNVRVFRDVTKEEKKLITRKYNPLGSDGRIVNISYEYGFSSNQEWAGHLLYESGNLKTQSTNLIFTSALTILTSGIITSRMAQNLNENATVPIQIGASISGIMSIVATVKNYKANRKMREAGILLQKR